MKHKLISLITLVLLCFYLAPLAVEANTDINELLPNEYQKNKFKKNNDFIHDSSNTKEMGEITEDQKTILFNGEKTFTPESTISQLFLSMSTENSTIKDKAENLKLFSNTEAATFQSKVTEAETTSSSFQLLIGVLIGVFLLVLVIVLVIYNRFTSTTK